MFVIYSPLKHVKSIFCKQKRVQLTLFLTRRCNSKCPFRFYLRCSDPIPPEDQELSVEDIEKMSRSLGPLFWVTVSGGKIYLGDDLAKISRIFHDVNKPPVILLTTNGMLPSVIQRTTERVLKE
jgi:molybdenum cofactor biosynthesis enzyme MoaA